MRAVAIRLVQIYFGHIDFFMLMRCFVKNAAERIGDKRSSPKFHRSVLFKAHAVHTHHMQPIGHRMAALNGLHVVSVNRVGLEQNGAMKFWGGSFITNPFGSILYKASHENEEVKVTEIDLNKTDSYRTHWPFLRDRRIDSYQPITKRFIDED